MMKWLVRILLSLAALFLAAFWQLFFSSRPPLTIDPSTLAGDGSTLDYCELPVLDGSGKTAAEIPKGNTPDCSYDHFPLPILAECTEPLIERRRGYSRSVDRRRRGTHRPCGAGRAMWPLLFTIGDREYCPRTSASKIWNDGVLDFHVFGWGPVVVRRHLDGDQLIWEYADGSTTRMDRICTLPEDQKIPRARGPRFSFY